MITCYECEAWLYDEYYERKDGSMVCLECATLDDMDME